MLDLDEMDLKILRQLQKDDRRSFTMIGEKLRASEATVRKRVQAMQKQRGIKRFMAGVDPSKLELNAVAIWGLRRNQ